MCCMNQLGVLETEEASCWIFVICAFFSSEEKEQAVANHSQLQMFLTDGVDTLIRAVGSQLEFFRFTECKKNWG